jgi:hypothetical protein
VDPKNLLLACKLLTTIGKQLDSDDDESLQDLDEYIKFLTGLLNTERIEVKVKVGRCLFSVEFLFYFID